MQRRPIIVLLLVLLMSSFALAQEATEEPAPESTSEPTAEVTDYTVYIVRPGDNLFRIALRNGLSTSELAAYNNIVNPALIFVGQEIRIPSATPQQPSVEPTAIATPTTTPDTSDTSEDELSVGNRYHTVQAGETLYRIAQSNGTTVAEIIALNNLANPNLLFVGQRLLLPDDSPEAIAPSQPETTDSSAGSSNVAFTGDAGFGFGVEVFLDAQNIPSLNAQVQQLGMGWVKLDVRWKDIEPVQGQPNFSALDTAVNAFDAAGINILLTVTTAPDWARGDNPVEDGPPADFGAFSNFMTALVSRYAGRVDAYEIWSEQNLRREWNSSTYPISAEHYVDLLSVAYQAVKALDPNAMVITGGLAPTGFNDGVNAINDRVYLQDMYSNGVEAVSDAIGAHPNGWANPPDARCCEPTEGVLTHYEDETFYFLETLEDYRAIMVRNGDGNTPIWVTRFGWGSSEGLTPPNDTFVFVSYTSLTEQATYIPQAYELGRELGYVGPMFLFNLNGCQSQPSRIEFCYFSLVNPDGSLRPAYSTILAMPKTEAPAEASPAAAPAQPTPASPPVIQPVPTPTIPAPVVPPPEATQESVG